VKSRSVRSATRRTSTFALAQAVPGDVITVGGCEFVGAFTVGQGVAVVGTGPRAMPTPEGPGATFFRPAIEGQVPLTLEPGDPPAVLRRVAVGALGAPAVAISGEGRAEIEEVRVLVGSAVGIAVADGADVALLDVTVMGPATTSPEGSPSREATFGIRGDCAAAVTLTDVTVSACSAGAHFVGGEVDWTGGAASDNLEVGIRLDGAVATLEGVDATGTREGGLLGLSYGLVVSNAAAVITRGLRVSDNAGIGMVHESSSAEHLGLVATGNGDAAADPALQRPAGALGACPCGPGDGRLGLRGGCRRIRCDPSRQGLPRLARAGERRAADVRLLDPLSFRPFRRSRNRTDRGKADMMAEDEQFERRRRSRNIVIGLLLAGFVLLLFLVTLVKLEGLS